MGEQIDRLMTELARQERVRSGDCPAFPADPVPHRWVPIESKRSGKPLAPIVVTEVCPSCRQYRSVDYYHQLKDPRHSSVPRDPDGVQSTP